MHHVAPGVTSSMAWHGDSAATGTGPKILVKSICSGDIHKLDLCVGMGRKLIYLEKAKKQ